MIYTVMKLPFSYRLWKGRRGKRGSGRFATQGKYSVSFATLVSWLYV